MSAKRKSIFAPSLTASALVLALCISSFAETGSTADPLAWPTPTRESRPWARWWWLGNAVDKTNLTRQLTQFRDAGFGGVEICPIYGVKGSENQFIQFLSPEWLEMFAHTSREAQRLGLGVDLTTGTGWPFGGPAVSSQIASTQLAVTGYEIEEVRKFFFGVDELVCIRAISEREQIDLTDKVIAGRLEWNPPAGKWRVYVATQRRPIQRVKRAAPGGEGAVIDPFSVSALNSYLARFDLASKNLPNLSPRAYFHDSFEYYGANWTPDFFREFALRRHYDLRTQLPALAGEVSPEVAARVMCDYRETISDLHLGWLRRWTDWCHEHQSLSREQAHGAPGNLLDLYAACDIPETETFGANEEMTMLMPMWKLASSAAHLRGKKLISAESFTWLNEHFRTSLAQMKTTADNLFLSGANHLVYHGIPYSPAEAAWPGWQFYAAVNFGPQGGLWRDLPAFNAYVTRCQSILQEGESQNDVLLYFPLHELFSKASRGLIPLTLHNFDGLQGPRNLLLAAFDIQSRGFSFDYVSDRFLAEATATNGLISIRAHAYRTVVVPSCELMPETTLQKLIELANAGAMIIFSEKFPSDVPGLGNLAQRRGTRNALVGRIQFRKQGELQRAVVGKGAFLLGKEIPELLAAAGAQSEPCVDAGLSFVKRRVGLGWNYFFVNRTQGRVSRWIPLGVPAKSAAILDPQFENRSGRAALRQRIDGVAEIYLQLQPGESCVVKTFDEPAKGAAWEYFRRDANTKPVSGVWQVRFVEGGPTLPAPFDTRQLASWTMRADAEARRFAGTARYTIDFNHPGNADDWLLELGRICESARVKVNGTEIGTLWSAPFEVRIGKFLRPGKNTLEIEVTNLAANRIADLDRRGVDWKYFYDANVMSKFGGKFDASKWPLFDSGLIGPVTLRALALMNGSSGGR